MYMTESAGGTREGGEVCAGPEREPGLHPEGFPRPRLRLSRPLGSVQSRSTFFCLRGSSVCASVPGGEVAGVLDVTDAAARGASACVSRPGGQTGSRDLAAACRVQLPRHACARVLALCIYTVCVESRFIYHSVKISIFLF